MTEGVLAQQYIEGIIFPSGQLVSFLTVTDSLYFAGLGSDRNIILFA